MKSGCNFADRNQIKEYVQHCLANDSDIDGTYISKRLRVQPAAVDSWVEHYLGVLSPAPEPEKYFEDDED